MSVYWSGIENSPTIATKQKFRVEARDGSTVIDYYG